MGIDGGLIGLGRIWPNASGFGITKNTGWRLGNNREFRLALIFRRDHRQSAKS